MKIILIDRVHHSFTESFTKWGWEVIEAYEWSENDLLNNIEFADGIIIRSRIKLNQNVLSKGINLKFIGRPGSGLENIDVEFCQLKNIKVFRSPEGNRDAVGGTAGFSCSGYLYSAGRNTAFPRPKSADSGDRDAGLA